MLWMPQSQHDAPFPSRRLLQRTVIYGPAASPPSPPPAGSIPMPVQNRFPQSSPVGDDANHFSPSFAIIMVFLLSAFFFMGFFSLYVRRCATRSSSGGRASLRHQGELYQERANQGIDPDILHTLPLVAYTSAKKKGTNVECVVCLTEFEEQEPLRQLPTCKHVFHQDCIDMWLFSHSTCPVCRRSIAGGSTGSLSFQWGGSGSFQQQLSLLSRGGSVAQDLPLASTEDAGASSLIESNGRDRMMGAIRRSFSAETTFNATSAGCPFAAGAAIADSESGYSNSQPMSDMWEQAGNGRVSNDRNGIRTPSGMAHLARANSTGHSLQVGLAHAASAPALPIGARPSASGGEECR